MIARAPRWLCLAAALHLSLAALLPDRAFAVRAQRNRARLVTKVHVKQRIQSPTFTPASWPQVMNRGRHLYLGRGLYHEHERLFLLDAPRGRRIRLQAPVDAWVRRHPGRFPGPYTQGRIAQYEVQKLLYYDEGIREAGLLVAEPTWRGPARFFHLHWDLARQRITRADRLGRKGPAVRWVSVKRIGYDPTRRRAYLQVVERIPGVGAGPQYGGSRGGRWGHRTPARLRRRNWGRERYRVRVIAVGRTAPKTLATFETKRRLSRGPHYDGAHHRALLVEYAERSDAVPAPKGYLVDLRGGRVRDLRIPLTTYGAAFTANGRALLLYGSQNGVLWRFDLRSWRVTRKRKMGTLGHGLGVPFPDTVMVLRHKILHLVDPVTLRERQRILTARYYRGFSHIEGSVVAPGWLFLCNKPWIYLIRLSR